MRGFLLSAAVALCGCSPDAQAGRANGARDRSSPPPPRVLLVTWDTTRADRVGCYGWTKAQTPNLDALAANGVLYERAWAAAPITLPSHTTILSGVLPPAHGVRDNGIFTVAADAKLLPEVLKSSGWRTAAFVGSFILDPKFGLNQGFDFYDAPDVSGVGLGWSVIERPAPAVAGQAIAFLDTVQPDDSFFLWVHFYDPHWPHELPPELRPRGMEDAEIYDAEIALCDQELGRILERIRARGLDDGLVTVVTADHGESNGEHGEVSHTYFVYDSSMRVPLVISPPPPGLPPGTRVRTPVSAADVAATLLDRVGLGRALLPDARSPTLPGDDEPSDRAIWLETYAPFFTHRWAPLRALVWKEWKYVEAPRPELYDLLADPNELADLHAQRADIAARMAARMKAELAENPPLDWGRKGDLSAEDRARLSTLGYLAAVIDGDPADSTLPDPKDRIGDLDVLVEIDALIHTVHDALGLETGLRTGRRPDVSPELKAKAEALLLQARAKHDALRLASPRDPFLDQIESTIELDLGNYAAAIPPLERAVVGAPSNMPVRYNLAVAYAMTNRRDWARREMEKCVFIEPRSLAAHRWMVQFTVSARDWAAAAWWSGELAKCPGQSAEDLERGARDRARILQELAKDPGDSGGVARPPAPVSEADLTPEGLKK